MKPKLTFFAIFAAAFCLLFLLVDPRVSLSLLGLLGAVTTEQYINKSHSSHRGKLPVASAKKLLGGTMSFADANGYGTDVVAAGANPFRGIVVVTVDNSAGADGAMKAEVHEDGKFLLVGAGFTQGDVAKKAYASDNFTISSSATSKTYIGTFSKFKSATEMWVDIDIQAA